MGWATAIQGGLQLGGALLGQHAANKASSAEQEAANKALELQQQMWQQQQANLQPFMGYGAGAGGLGGLSQLMGGDYSGFMNSPDFKARVQFANDQFNNGAAAKYRLFSGGAQNDRDELNQNLAAQGLGDYRNALMWGANLGQNAAAGVGQAGQNYANQAGNLYGQIGNAQASGALTNANIWGQTLGGLAGLAGSAFGNPSKSAYTGSYGGGNDAAQFGLPTPVAPYSYGSGGKYF